MRLAAPLPLAASPEVMGTKTNGSGRDCAVDWRRGGALLATFGWEPTGVPSIAGVAPFVVGSALLDGRGVVWPRGRSGRVRESSAEPHGRVLWKDTTMRASP